MARLFSISSAISSRVGQVDLVEHGQDLVLLFHGEVGIGNRLGLNSLGSIDQEHRAFTGLQAFFDLVAEVHMTWRVDQVELVALALVLVVDRHGPGLDGDAPFALQFHVVQDLGAHVARLDGARDFEHAIRQRRLAVVDVRDDREVADVLGVHGGVQVIAVTRVGSRLASFLSARPRWLTAVFSRGVRLAKLFPEAAWPGSVKRKRGS